MYTIGFVIKITFEEKKAWNKDVTVNYLMYKK